MFACGSFPWWVAALYWGFWPLVAGLSLMGGWWVVVLLRGKRPRFALLVSAVVLLLLAMLAMLHRFWFG